MSLDFDDESKNVFESKLDVEYDTQQIVIYLINMKDGTETSYPQYKVSKLIEGLLYASPNVRTIKVPSIHPAIFKYDTPNSEIKIPKPCPIDFDFPSYIPDNIENLVSLINDATYLQIPGLISLATAKFAVLRNTPIKN